MSNIFKKLKDRISYSLDKTPRKLDSIYELYKQEDDILPRGEMKKVSIFVPELNGYKDVWVKKDREIIRTPQELNDIIKKIEIQSKKDTIVVDGKEMKKVKIYIPEFNEYRDVLIETSRDVLLTPQQFKDVLSDITELTKESTKDDVIDVKGKKMKKVYIYVPEFNEYKQVLVDEQRPIPMSRYSLDQLIKEFIKNQDLNKKLNNDIYKTIDNLYKSILLDENARIGEDITKRSVSLFDEFEEEDQKNENEGREDYDYIEGREFINPSNPSENEFENDSDIFFSSKNKDGKYNFLDLYSESSIEDQDDTLEMLTDDENNDTIEKKDEDEYGEKDEDGEEEGKIYKLLDDYTEEYNENENNNKENNMNANDTTDNTEDMIFSFKKNNKRKSLSRYYD